MKTESPQVTIHMVSSLDGFIAKKDGDVSWMQSTDSYDKGVTLTNEYIEDFLKSIDCYVMGSKTYEHALELGWPYGDKPVIVLTHRKLTTDKPNLEFYAGDLNDLVSSLKRKYKNIWMVGGAKLTREFIHHKLADIIVLSILPILIGDGLPFFDHIGSEQKLHLLDTAAFRDGMVELTYEIIKD